jgi:hypothetical protein
VARIQAGYRAPVVVQPDARTAEDYRQPSLSRQRVQLLGDLQDIAPGVGQPRERHSHALPARRPGRVGRGSARWRGACRGGADAVGELEILKRSRSVPSNPADADVVALLARTAPEPATENSHCQQWTWQDEHLGAFARGTSNEPGRARPEYGTKITPEGGGRWHRNDAGVTE